MEDLHHKSPSGLPPSATANGDASGGGQRQWAGSHMSLAARLGQPQNVLQQVGEKDL